MADYDQIMKALRNAHAAGDTAAARRLAQMALAARQQPATPAAPAQASPPAQQRQIVPGGFEMGSGQLSTRGPGPTGYVDPQLYEMGAIARRMEPGQADTSMAMVARTGTEMPRMVRAADGTEFYLDPRTGSYSDRIGMKMQEDQRANPARALGSAFARGYTVNAADEIAGAIDPAARERLRAVQDANQEKYPWLTVAGELAGNIASPVTKALPVVNTIRGAVGVAGGMGFLDAFNRGEGDLASRASDGAVGAGGAMAFAFPLAMVGKGISKGFDVLAKNANERPSLETFRLAKNAAYRAVDNSGEVFSGDDMARLADRARAVLAQADFDDIADPQTAASLRVLERRSGQEVSISRLDRLRQTLWSRYNRGDEPLVLDLINEIDGLIDERAGTSALMTAARDANSTFRRVEMLEDAFNKAELQTAATGSGGNILNKYRQAVTAIITDPKKAKWFSDEQVAVMDSFVRGNASEDLLRRIGKMAPGGNGLMTFLNVYGATLDPSFLAATVAAQTAKTSADNMSVAGKERVLDSVAGFARPAPTGPGLTPLASGAGVTADNVWEARP